MSIKQSFILGIFNSFIIIGVWYFIIAFGASETLKFSAFIVGMVIYALLSLLVTRGDKLGKWGYVNTDPRKPYPKYKMSAFLIGTSLPTTIALTVYMSAAQI